jgi:hypothetical protein
MFNAAVERSQPAPRVKQMSEAPAAAATPRVKQMSEAPAAAEVEDDGNL